jgi:hypothetical protein
VLRRLSLRESGEEFTLLSRSERRQSRILALSATDTNEELSVRCEELLTGLNDYLDGEQRSALCQAFREHLGDCESCRIVVDNIRQTIAIYRDGKVMPMPTELHARIRAVMQDRWNTRH